MEHKFGLHSAPPLTLPDIAGQGGVIADCAADSRDLRPAVQSILDRVKQAGQSAEHRAVIDMLRRDGPAWLSGPGC